MTATTATTDATTEAPQAGASGFTGGCLCGSVRYRSAMAPQLAADCYCTDCRRASGTSHCTHAVIAEDAFELSGEVARYDRPADSGNIVTRAFCPQCGSAVCSTNAGMPGMMFVRVSSFDDPGLGPPQMSVFAKSAPAWARPATDRPVFQTMPPGGVPAE